LKLQKLYIFSYFSFTLRVQMSVEYLLQKRFLFGIANSSKVLINAYKSGRDYHIFIRILGNSTPMIESLLFFPVSNTKSRLVSETFHIILKYLNI